jgi:ABC-2 type transport system permease protein
MHDLRTILGAKSVMVIRNIIDIRLHGLTRTFSTIAIFNGVAIGMFLLMRNFTWFLVYHVGVGIAPLHRLAGIVLFAFFVSANFMSLILSFATLYTAREVEFLQSLPVPHAKLFLLRMGENVITSTGVLSLLGIAGVLGYGAVFHLAWYQYALMMFGVMMPLVVTAGILGVLLLMILIYLAGRVGMRWMLAIALPSYVASFFVYYRATNPVAIIHSAVATAHGAVFFVPPADEPYVAWLPHAQAASALQGIVQGDVAATAHAIAALIGGALFLGAVAVVTGSRLYYTTWLLVRELKNVQEHGHRLHRFWLLDLQRRLTHRPNAEAVLKRDILQFVRDPVQRIHALMMAVLIAVMIFSGVTFELPSMQAVPRALSWITIFLFDGFVITSIALRFVFPAVSLEGNAFWCVRTSPISLSRLYWMKFLLWFPIIFVPAEALVLCTLPMVQAPQQLTVIGTLAMLCAVVGLVSLNLGAGAHFATLREDNPVKVAASQGASVTFLLSLLYLLGIAALLATPVVRTLAGAPPLTTQHMLFTALMIVAAVSGVVTVFAHIIGIHSLRKDF